MIRWCAYCQTYQGERPPLDDYSMTHGMCSACQQKSAMTDAAAMRAMRHIVDFHQRLRLKAHSDDSMPVQETLAEARSLGVGPVDLLFGMLQPALYEIGAQWARGEVTIATEHRFSAAVERIAGAIADDLPAQIPKRGALDFLLVNAEGNHHTLGPRFLELFLRSRGRSTFLVVPGLPSAEIIALARRLEPATLGVSISLPQQAEVVREVADALADAPRRPDVVLGGYAVKMGLALDPAIRARACANAYELVGERPLAA